MINGTKTRAELDHYIAANNFRVGQQRIGVSVWLSPGARPKHELTLSLTGGMICLYTRSPRALVQKWSLKP